MFKQRPEKRERAMEIFGGRNFKAEETASSKALRWKWVSCVRGTASINSANVAGFEREKQREISEEAKEVLGD